MFKLREGFLVPPEDFRRFELRIEGRWGWIGDDLGANFVKASGSLRHFLEAAVA